MYKQKQYPLEIHIRLLVISLLIGYILLLLLFITLSLYIIYRLPGIFHSLNSSWDVWSFYNPLFQISSLHLFQSHSFLPSLSNFAHLSCVVLILFNLDFVSLFFSNPSLWLLVISVLIGYILPLLLFITLSLYILYRLPGIVHLLNSSWGVWSF